MRLKPNQTPVPTCLLYLSRDRGCWELFFSVNKINTGFPFIIFFNDITLQTKNLAKDFFFFFFIAYFSFTTFIAEFRKVAIQSYGFIIFLRNSFRCEINTNASLLSESNCIYCLYVSILNWLRVSHASLWLSENLSFAFKT